MFTMTDKIKTDPPAAKTETPANDTADSQPQSSGSNILSWMKSIVSKGKTDTLRETLVEFIEEAEDSDNTEPVSNHERILISNVLKFRNLTVVDVMIPRPDIVAIDVSTSQSELLSLLSEKQFSRYPVYRETLDDVLGTIHIKDILACLAQGKPIKIEDLIHDVQIVSPSMPVSDLILSMKQKRKHMALVIDEYGGIDGLVTIGDVIESIFGEVDDEHNNDDSEPQMMQNADSSVIADGRLDIDTFESKFGTFLKENEREEIDTIGGLIFFVAGRIPGRGEIVTHTSSGIKFEIIDADPRRVNRVRITNIPQPTAEDH